jgi:hypothetical protein
MTLDELISAIERLQAVYDSMVEETTRSKTVHPLGNQASCRQDIHGRALMKPDLKMSEAEFKDMVISIAKRYGWLVHHDLPAQNTRGRWMTNVQGDVGFPDLFMVHPFQGGRPLVIELKAEKGKVTPGQKIWLNACELAGCHAAVWKPSDMEYILYTLSNPRA